MFEIRVICDSSEADRIATTLAAMFTTGMERRYPSRNDAGKVRLYVAADHQPLPEPCPTPDEAYATAPSIISEIGWTADQAATRPFGTTLGREFWLRKAALLDRIAVADETEGWTSDATKLATEGARRLLQFDRDGDGRYGGAPHWPEHPQAEADPRAYVRQEYAHWAKHQ
ncbi:hypothetical protein FCH28_11315 [Streptomyces piniterrae]|uniref:Uncharacterized protein n=1 Tax=Streptomyces piniterrae TaxID=2571125 RepID=A0A4U0NN48_9ACTN|nr:hypothetical protein [Streptomyces piniterrae]TJZ55869.1 hypothetical protein FCH28_11315 [Streptomyces piniterrae]